MRRSFHLQCMTLLVGALALVVLTGCSRSRSLDRAKVLEAENINLRQRTATMEQQILQAHAGQDNAVAREQQLRAELVTAKEEAKAAAAARERAVIATEQLNATQEELTRAEQRLAAAKAREAELQRKLLAMKTPPAAKPRRTGAPLRRGGTSPEVEAMRRDLQRHLAGYGIRDLKVEVRTDRQGRQRVAIVLPDAFRPGKATLAYNKSAVSAVMSVGKMIREQYPESTVLIEGHTDSDPIRKSNWGTNERLSEARAKAVETLLTASGIPHAQVHTAGFGARQPLAAGSTRRAKSRNRRVEIFISPRS